MAILEFRAAETGDVIRQYPTESQIRAFQRASELDTRKAEAVARQARQQVLQQETLAASSAGEGVSQGESFTPAAPQPAPALVAAAPAATAPSGGEAPVSGGDTGETPQHAVSTFA